MFLDMEASGCGLRPELIVQRASYQDLVFAYLALVYLPADCETAKIVGLCAGFAIHCSCLFLCATSLTSLTYDALMLVRNEDFTVLQNDQSVFYYNSGSSKTPSMVLQSLLNCQASPGDWWPGQIQISNFYRSTFERLFLFRRSDAHSVLWSTATSLDRTMR